MRKNRDISRRQQLSHCNALSANIHYTKERSVWRNNLLDRDFIRLTFNTSENSSPKPAKVTMLNTAYMNTTSH